MSKHQRHSNLLQRWFPFACTVILSGCATVVDIAERHRDANLVQEQVMNQQLLLNIVRASHRQPLHFSRIPFIKLPLISSAPWELSFPFGVVGAYGRNTAKSSIGGALITVEVSPQDSQEFIQGITTPVRLSLMDFYFQQGWPKQLLLYLLVEEMRLLEKTEICEALKQEVGKPEACDPAKPKLSSEVVAERLRNNPGDEAEIGAFAKAIDTITRCELFVRSDPVQRGPRLSEPWMAPLSGLPEAVNAGLLGYDGEGLALQLAVQTRLELRQPKGIPNDRDCLLPELTAPNLAASTSTPAAAAPDSQIPGVMKKLGATEKLKVGVAPKTLQRGTSQVESTWVKAVVNGKQVDGKLQKVTNSVEIATRSPDSIVYYLGEVLRNPNRVTVARDGNQRSRATLFGAKVNATVFGLPPTETAVWVDYWGQRYAIPWPNSRLPDDSGVGSAAPKDRSMQVLAFLGQILQLQNKATAPPRSTTVRVEP